MRKSQPFRSLHQTEVTSEAASRRISQCEAQEETHP